MSPSTVSNYLANQFYTQDIGHIDYLFYHTYHGRFFWSVVCEAPHFSKHFTPTLVLLVPFHALFQNVLFITILEDLVVLSGAWGSGVDGRWVAASWAVAGRFRKRYADSLPWGLRRDGFMRQTPSWGSVLLAHHFESFALALTAWALAALTNRRWCLFWILVILALGVKEDMTLYWGAFGAWWVVIGIKKEEPGSKKEELRTKKGEGRGARVFLNWRKRFVSGGALLGLCIVWLVVAMVVIRHTALASGQPASEYAPRYDWLGKTMSQARPTPSCPITATSSIPR